ncbi:MAG: hypothetical protein QNI87_04480 [Erythrobacter sp.]|uniref:TadE/TadG family type IV pilus assembly protein n=1 Tax=Erythrobacter sp. TaxID=1042 RepID=UPI00261251AD|nr:hypothetical protein [Erythrobacter sp.]MDJ0977771.1 hypothetical protein [Erythrobacter sp.]
MIARFIAHRDRPADPVIAAPGGAAANKPVWKWFGRRLAQAQSGIALTEFAFTAPIVLSLGLMGSETAYYTITHMQISQIAMQVADNTSRVGEASELQAKRVFEDDINSSLVGAEKAGDRIGLFDHGRVIVSSLQRNADNGQWIAWQRCRGAKPFDSSYGVEGTGASGTSFQGMGEPGEEIQAAAGTAVMFVEVSYDYQSLTPFDFLDGNEIRYTAAFNVRDERDLAGLYQTNPPTGVARCNVYQAGRP